MTFIFPRSWLSGLTLSTAGSSSTFSVAAGQCSDDANTVIMNLASPLSKTTAAFAEGTGNGSFDGTGPAPSSTGFSWFHVHLIERLDTGGIDVLTSNSETSPTLPANYTVARRLGSMKTNGSFQWIGFVQNGDKFLWLITAPDANAVAVSTTAALVTLSVPPAKNINALFNGLYVGDGTQCYVYFYAPAQGTQTSSASGPTVSLSAAAGTPQAAGQFNILTNSSAQIGVVGQAAHGTYYIGTYGWIDRRGRDG